MTSLTDIRRAAEAIRRGDLVIFPTETVYGLGANALNEAAVKRIFEVKGRPSTSPLIVHVASIEAARELAAEWPEIAHRLAEAFWPGPLTIVVSKKAMIPDIVTAGLPSVGLRIPANNIALALISESGVPIAAPSANRFTELSPTRAEHARRSLGDQAAVILDGGPTDVGIESTVIAVNRSEVQLLRPGMLTRRQIEEVAGPLSSGSKPSDGPHRSPGQHPRHYRPRTPLLVAGANELPKAGQGAFLRRTDSDTTFRPANLLLSRDCKGADAGGYATSDPARSPHAVSMPQDPRAYAARLFAVLHELDDRDFDWIAIEPLPETPEWDGIRDRLRRASAQA